jgi:hypothetical protein
MQYCFKLSHLYDSIIIFFIQCSILPRRVEDIYKEYIQTTYTSQIDSKNIQIKWKQIDLHYNYAAVELTFLIAINFITNGTVNRIICDDDRINCNFLALNIFIKFRTDSVYIFVQYISQSMVILTSKEKMKLIFNLF